MKISLRLLIACLLLPGSAWAAGVAAQTASASEPDLVSGAKIFELCAACHEPGKAPRTGPELRGVVGRRSATVPGFRYSRAMRRVGLTWDEATLDAYLANPQALVAGTTMPFPGIADESQRRDLIGYIKSLK